MDLAGRGPIGQKAAKQPRTGRKRIKPMSDKRKARKAAEKAREKDMKSELAAHLRDQVGALTDPFKARKQSRKDGMVRSF